MANTSSPSQSGIGGHGILVHDPLHLGVRNATFLSASNEHVYDYPQDVIKETHLNREPNDSVKHSFGLSQGINPLYGVGVDRVSVKEVESLASDFGVCEPCPAYSEVIKKEKS